MKAIVISVLVLVLLTGGFLLYRDYYVKRKFRKLSEQKYRIVAPLVQKITSHESVPESEILTMAKDPSLRHALFRALEVCQRRELFPAEYLTHEKGAEGFLVNWLEFPTELGTAPDEIELLTKITLQERETLDYYVFRYRVKKPGHWAAKHNWMIGVSGPYRSGSLPYDMPRRVFSRFNIIESISPEREVQWVHKNIGRKQL